MLNSKKEILYSYNDVMIKPAVVSSISSRKECCPYLNGTDKLPIFTAPMSTVVNEKNFDTFEQNHINAILPRNIDFATRVKYAQEGKWAAFSLQEFKSEFIEGSVVNSSPDPIRALIDVANGHMSVLYDMVKEAKKKYGCDKIEIMIGNIANPDTIIECEKAGVDYVRCGIGAGMGCVTTSNCSIHFPMASLISKIKEKSYGTTKIIADGGIRNYSDVIKALALGADYVMIGGLFASTLEACGYITYTDETYKRFNEFNKDCVLDVVDPEKISYQSGRFFITTENNIPFKVELERRFYGMASKSGQCDISGSCHKTAEGIEKIIPVTITLGGWVENMSDYLRSAMSYCDCRKVEDLYYKAECKIISQATKASINK